MSVVSVQKPSKGQQNGELIGFGTGNRDFEYIIKFNSNTDGELTALASGLIPLPGSSLLGAPQMVLRRYSHKRLGRFAISMVAHYSSENDTQAQRQIEGIAVPWLRAARIQCSYHEETREPYKDLNGRLYVNSAGDPFKSNPPRLRSLATYVVEKDVPANPSWYSSYKNKLNSAAVTLVDELGVVETFAFATLMFVPKSVTAVQYAGPNDAYRFKTVTFELRHDPDGWQYKPLDQGPKYYTEPPNSKKVAYFEGGVSSECILNGGGRLAPTPWTSYPGYFHEFKEYDHADFSALPLA